ncbi:MAG: hypothetical protein K2O01_03215, partial [Bacteroidales bacterium]|nr:hypothetical protein [Bacteroidales bacterium]
RSRAERYLSKAGQSPEAVYARGNCAALRGDYGMAESLFGQAAERGVAEAAAALERLRTLQAAPEPDAPVRGKTAKAGQGSK